ncbi:DUF2231 domain-containing protein [Hephaestia sp. GCM10023244]|uniref:DUF2231 domain-containing protein n=1 Tax=unclassified Hephaestia TaxID=2631281 RepID=UPI00207701C3|nr:DUF2231 domain-containing protein [Hephaestia sp. MAHUQ-44]MCM8730782.1 DUF2231 domain-containing protein [Hephaestia sp. MAHUQ-44]
MRLIGHPLHPMLVHFPIAFWVAGSVGDVLTLAGLAGARPIAWLAIGVGDAVALATMAAGLVDFTALDERLVPAAMRHIALMATAWLLYTIAFVWRSHGFAPGDGPVLLPALCGFAGMIALLGGAWQGGELVYRHGAGAIPQR